MWLKSLKSLGTEFVVIAKDNDQLETLRKEGVEAVGPPHISTNPKKSRRRESFPFNIHFR